MYKRMPPHGDYDYIGEANILLDNYKVEKVIFNCGSYNYIDLLLYNIKYKCYVVIELKVTELRSKHTGQIMTYMRMLKQLKKMTQQV